MRIDFYCFMVLALLSAAVAIKEGSRTKQKAFNFGIFSKKKSLSVPSDRRRGAFQKKRVSMLQAFVFSLFDPSYDSSLVVSAKTNEGKGSSNHGLNGHVLGGGFAPQPCSGPVCGPNGCL